jgi:uracil-DNA glycosylase
MLTNLMTLIKSHLVIVLGAIVALYFLMFSGKKGGRRSRTRGRVRSYGSRAYGRVKSMRRSRRRY